MTCNDHGGITHGVVFVFSFKTKIAERGPRVWNSMGLGQILEIKKKCGDEHPQLPPFLMIDVQEKMSFGSRSPNI